MTSRKGDQGTTSPEDQLPGTAKNKTLSEKALSGFGWTSLLMGAQAIVQIVALILLARLLPPQDFGLFAAAMVVGGFCKIFSEIGIGPAIVQREDLRSSHIRSGFTMAVVLSLGVAALIWWAAPMIAGFFNMPQLIDILRIMTLGFPMQGLSSVAQSMALRSFRFRWLAKIEALAFGLGFVIVAPILTLFDYGVMALIGAFLTQQIARAAFLLIGQPHEKRPMLDLRAVGELLYFGTGFSIAKVFNYFASQADNIVVGRFLGATALGVYGHAYQLMSAPAMLIGTALDKVLFPTMASVQHEKERLRRAYRTGIYACAMIVLPLSAGIAVLAPEIVLMLLGPNWVEVTLPLRILACAMLFRTSYKISDTIVKATGAVYARAVCQATFACAVLGAALIGQRYGLGGVAYGVAAALALNFLLMAQLSHRLTGMTWGEFWGAHLPGASFGGLVAVVSWAVASFLRGQDFGVFAIVALVTPVAMISAAAALFIWPRWFIGGNNLTLLATLARLVPKRLQGLVGVLQRRAAE